VVIIATVSIYLVRQDSPLFNALPFLILRVLLVSDSALLLVEDPRMDERELGDCQRVRDRALLVLSLQSPAPRSRTNA
jgi:hypothetical protein